MAKTLSGLTGNQIAASCAIGLSTLGVPLFLMISGYLLLDRDYTKERTLTFFKRNLLPLVVSYEIFDLRSRWCNTLARAA
mgnify:CR=1 FL=1